jgi:Spy/CpxP family protein refolding chaperone
MRNRYLLILFMTAMLSANYLAVSAPLLMAQSSQVKGDIEQLKKDLHAGMDRSTLSESQKAQMRDDFRELREAHQNHQLFAGLRAARSIRMELDSGAFKPEDQKKIKEDIEAIREAREANGGPGGF